MFMALLQPRASIHYMTLLDSMARVQLDDDNDVFVVDANAHHSRWLEWDSPTDRHGRDDLDFCNLSGCEQLVRIAIHIAGNRLDPTHVVVDVG